MPLNPNQIASWGKDAHNSVNHLYGQYPYSFHLVMVVRYCQKFENLLAPEDHETAYATCWLHDTIEDCRKTYNDIEKIAGTEVAEAVYALSNEKGKNRAERASDKYYQGIKENKIALFVKLCDRLANLGYSVVTNESMAEVYKKENDSFCEKLYDPRYESMFNELKILASLVK